MSEPSGHPVNGVLIYFLPQHVCSIDRSQMILDWLHVPTQPFLTRWKQIRDLIFKNVAACTLQEVNLLVQNCLLDGKQSPRIFI